MAAILIRKNNYMGKLASSSLLTLLMLPVRQQPLVAIVIFMGTARKRGVIVYRATKSAKRLDTTSLARLCAKRSFFPSFISH